MKQKMPLVLFILLCLSVTGCGKQSELPQFQAQIEEFCTRISAIDTSMNGIDASSDTAIEELLEDLDSLDLEFQGLKEMDFPDEFDYLEDVSREASDYMAQAVASYHEAFGSGSYHEALAEYAKQYYSRAYKRIQVILSFLHGEEPDDSADLTIEVKYEEP
ncbi:MAG: hypothetical protein LBQ15_11805 [Clostridium sp.]|nr:hypothetical protein [Clostridium sp.]